jgi:hypothetical protein
VSAVLTLDALDHDSWEHTAGDMRGQCTKAWLLSPEHGRWMRKTTECEEGGAWREALIARAAHDLGLLSYPCFALTDNECLMQHVEDANPEWECLGNYYQWHENGESLPADVWLPYAVFSVVFGVEDRNTTNSMVMRHRATGELRLASIDHECACGDSGSWPTFADRSYYATEPVMLSRFEAELDAMLAAALRSDFAEYVNHDNICDIRRAAREGYLGGVIA